MLGISQTQRSHALLCWMTVLMANKIIPYLYASFVQVCFASFPLQIDSWSPNISNIALSAEHRLQP